MVKDTPRFLQLAAMVVFTMSCFGLLLFLWLAFGGSIPLKPEGYRLKVAFPEAATLAQEADVRLAGVNVGKVKTKQLEARGARTLVELELDSRYAPTQLDEIFAAFDEPTRKAFQDWMKELARAIEGRPEDLNSALGNLEGFAVDGATLLSELDKQDVALRRLVKNTGVVFGAVNEREGALGELITNANET